MICDPFTKHRHFSKSSQPINLQDSMLYIFIAILSIYSRTAIGLFFGPVDSKL